ncbi:RNA-directed DNA polymerase, eukaryota [Tanacetum coccineum]|uniref:RNA-directed DNA polymerase, eukaryota n=1 Tax=Tanacetum coccineum TaxID=301880 RepID=A0ABQ5J5A4_9ASTR
MGLRRNKTGLVSFRSKEDDVNRISTLIFITNFPDSTSAKDLFHSCKQYGHVVDSFIPAKRSKEGKRFGFVRFINVFNVERLVSNLNTIWVDRFKLHANVVRFQRDPLKTPKTFVKKKDQSVKGGLHNVRLGTGGPESVKSFAIAVKFNNKSLMMEGDSIPAIVLDDECLNLKDLSKSLLGKVKEFALLSTLKTALSNEGFEDVGVRYMGELWVLLEFASDKSKQLFSENVGVGYWFSELRQGSMDLSPEGSIIWVEVEGVPFKFWSEKTFKRIASKWGELLDIDDKEESCFHSKRLCMYTKHQLNIFENFKLIYQGKVFWIRAKEVPGWVPELLEGSDTEDNSEDELVDGDNQVHDVGSNGDISDSEDGLMGNINKIQDVGNNGGISGIDEVPETVFDESTGFKANQSEDPFNIYSLLLKKGNKDIKEQVYVEDQSLKYPPGYTPKDVENEMSVNGDDIVVCNKDGLQLGKDGDRTNSDSKGDAAESVCSGRFKTSESPRTRDGNSGGILCVWDPNSFRKTNHTISDYFVIIRGVWLKSGTDLIIVAVYAPHDLRDKRMVWDYLVHTINQWKGEVVIMRDFNKVRFKSDRFGSIFNAQGADKFNAFITNAGLDEVQLGGNNFTWCHKSVIKMSKLDRFFISQNLVITCPNITAITLERFLSDHCPILLRESSNDDGPVSFHFFHHWIKLDGFNNHVIESWKTAPVDNTHGIRNVMGKLKFVKLKIREWIKKYRHNLNEVMDRYKEELRGLDMIIDNGLCTDSVVTKRVEVIKDMKHIDNLHAMDMVQKAKIKWCVEGDENSRFFHGMLNSKRNQQNIRGVLVDGIWKEKPQDVKREIFYHFRNRFDKPSDLRATVDMCFPRALKIDQQEDLERAVTRDEVKRAVWDCGIDKSPGPDGFTFGGCNSSFIALIPKINGANLVKDFRPISLIGSIYKIIAKILANRLVGVLGDIVNEVQSAFISERQILDGPFILNEVIQWCKTKKKQYLIFKVDFEKAYDFVRWDFLDDVLRKFGFGNKWCEWIQSCLKSSRGSILINGSPTEEFQFFKGLKQGKWSDRNINTLIHVLVCFYRASGLRMNISKSKIMGVHVEDTKVKHDAAKLGCLTLKSPFSYLGTKVGGSMSRVEAWKEVVEKVKSKLSKWKMKALSIGGRLTLLKSILGSIPTFYMSIFRVPSSVLHTLESIRCYFFNGHEAGSNKATWVRWKNVLSDKDNGGLGVSSLYALNRVIRAIHGEDGKVGKLKLGNGTTTSFWNDKWYGGGVLKDLFPRLYALENSKSVTVYDKLSDPSLDISFRRKTRGGVEQLQFNVASIRKLIDAKRLPIVSSSTRWVKYVPIKFNVLAWKIKLDALPTRLNISRRGIDIHHISCPVCDSGVESLDHLFFICCLSRQIGRKIALWWNVSYVEVESYEEWKSWLVSLRLASKLKRMLEGIFYVLWWKIWSFRNKLLLKTKLL